MATKSTATTEKKSQSEETSDSPLLDTLGGAVKKMLARGKERGFVTYDELNSALPPEQVSSEQIEDTMTRFIIAEDFDGDGQREIIAASKKTGLYRVNPGADGWTVTQFDANSSSFEHAIVAADLDGDDQVELYVAADNQQELKRYDWNAETKTFDKTLIGKLQPSVFTWSIEAGTL